MPSQARATDAVPPATAASGHAAATSSPPRVTAAPSAAVAPSPTAAQVYVVVAGDTLWDIAQRFGVSMDALLAVNPQIADAAIIHAGDRITLPSGAGPGTAAGLAMSAVPRAPADPAAAGRAAQSINAFGAVLSAVTLSDPTLGLGDVNFVFSPTSIVLALALARAGALGDTAAQMDAVLHAHGWDELGPGLNSLDQALASRNATWERDMPGGPMQQSLTLRSANAAFAQQGWTIEQAYLDAIAADLGSGLRLVDYRADPELARKAINAWVSQRTAGRIPELIKVGDVDTLTRLALVNAMYLRANWQTLGNRELFDPADTRPAPFTRRDGTRIEVPTMQTVGEQAIPYAMGNGWQAVELRYQGGPGYRDQPLALTLVLPEDLVSFGQRLTASQLARITTALENQHALLQQVSYRSDPPDFPDCGTYPYSVDLFLPKFDIRTALNLKPVLQDMALGIPFTPDANFGGIHVPEGDGDRLFISKVVHQATMSVDETGTEASAATAVLMSTGGGCGGPDPLRTITLRLDRPFLFFLRDLGTGAVLFAGRVTDPSAGATR